MSGCSQQPQWRYIGNSQDITVPLGDTSITARLTVYNDTLFPYFLHLHHNEATAETSIQRYLETNGGAYLSLVNNRQRNLSFTVSGKRYVADPNRVFTPQGIRQSLLLLSTFDSSAAKALTAFSENINALLIDSLPLIAVHNNTEGAYSILSYTPKGELAKDAARINYNSKMDADDFVLTTDEALFYYLRDENINAVLQANAVVQDDGSLSVVMGRAGISYANIETEHGHEQTQLHLLQTVTAFLRQQSNTIRKEDSTREGQQK